MAKKAETTARKALTAPLPIDLALQGGGSHGAFTWGVLDRILEEENIEIDGISGTSAGAMNAAVLAAGMAGGGRQTARDMLTAFWRKTSEAARFSPLKRGPLERITGDWSLDNSPAFLAMDIMARMVSPYSLGGIAGNPLRDLLAEIIHFPDLAEGPIKLFITATNVHTGQGRVFRKHEITVDVLLASACLPSMFQAIEIDGVPYWDGGYAGNPTMTPLVRECDSHDTLIVQINPVERLETPKTAREIASRLNEISFNAQLLKELRMMALLRRVVDPGHGEARQWKEMRLHRITSDIMVTLGHSSKLNAEWDFLQMLFEEGRRAAIAFGQAHLDDVGVRSTFDIDQLVADV
ncbi:patatin-like phospholipase family protein [Rhizobium sp. SL42]|nr:patatin-like phospholipase family protein [Rhizobium sp. SL42]UJW76688.1 patatin-like phospholipase family protein [Rhizobium sp. SL42]